MGSHTEVTKLPILMRQNFVIWKKRVETYLDSLDYLIVVQNEVAEGLTAEQLTTWRRIDKKAKHVISSMVPDQFYSVVDGKETSKKMFEALSDHFMEKSVSKQIHLKRELIQLRLKGEEVLTDFFVRFENLTRDLEAAGATMKEEDKLSYLFMALPKSYDAVTTSLENKDDLNLNEAKRRLLAEETKQNGRNGPLMETEEASAFRLIQKEGYSAPKSREAHFASGSSGILMVATRKNEEKTVVATVENNKNCVTWQLDSGATDHMCNNLSFFDSVVDLTVPYEIELGESGKSILATKKAKLDCYSDDGLPLNITDVLFVPKLRCNLLSIRKLASHGITVIFKENRAILVKDENVVAIAYLQGKLYQLTVNVRKESHFSSMVIGMDKLDTSSRPLDDVLFKIDVEIANEERNDRNNVVATHEASGESFDEVHHGRVVSQMDEVCSVVSQKDEVRCAVVKNVPPESVEPLGNDEYQRLETKHKPTDDIKTQTAKRPRWSRRRKRKSFVKYPLDFQFKESMN